MARRRNHYKLMSMKFFLVKINLKKLDTRVNAEKHSVDNFLETRLSKLPEIKMKNPLQRYDRKEDCMQI